jgi:hypothetical protein
MSAGPRIFLGVICCLVALAFLLLGPAAGKLGNEFSKGPWPFYALAAFSGCIAFACLVPASLPITLRVIGAAVFVGCTWYLYQDLHTPTMWRALACFCVFAVPAAYVTVLGKYPDWGKAASAFGSGRHHEEAEE